MTGEKAIPSKVDSTSIDVKYEDISEDRRKQFEAQLKKEQEEATRRFLACYEKTRQGVVEKEKFVMPTFTPPPLNPSAMAIAAAPSPPLPNSSTTAIATAPSATTTSDVSFSFESIKQFAEAFCSRFEQSQKLTQDLLIDLNLQNMGKRVANDYSNQTPNASLLAAPTENYQYGMPPNYFVGQTPPPGTVRPSMAEPVRLVQPTGQTGASVAGSV